MEDPTAAIAAARAHTDPGDRAKALTELLGDNGLPAITKTIRDERRDAVIELHEQHGLSWAQIGAILGVHRVRASQIAAGLPDGNRTRAAEKAARHAGTTPEEVAGPTTGGTITPSSAVPR